MLSAEKQLLLQGVSLGLLNAAFSIGRESSKLKQFPAALIKAARDRAITYVIIPLSFSFSVVKKVITPTDAPKDTWPFSVASDRAGRRVQGSC